MFIFQAGTSLEATGGFHRAESSKPSHATVGRDHGTHLRWQGQGQVLEPIFSLVGQPNPHDQGLCLCWD